MFEDALTPKPKPIKHISSVNEEIVIKYTELEKEINSLSQKTPDTSILEKIIQVKHISSQPPQPLPKPERPHKKQININWNLKYIIITNSEKVAFLNGKIVKIGDVIYGARIIDIKPDCVAIKTDKGIKCIYLNH